MVELSNCIRYFYFVGKESPVLFTFSGTELHSYIYVATATC